MRTVGCLSILAILPLTFASTALAQASAVPPPTGFAPPPPAVSPAPQPQPAQQPGAALPPPVPTPGAPLPAPAAPPPPSGAQPAGTPAATPDPGLGAAPQAAGSGELSFSTGAEAVPAASSGTPAETPTDDEQWYREHREASLHFANTLSGSVGLLHMQTPFSGAAGTFRASFSLGYYSGSGFLCKSAADCDPTKTGQDKAKTASSDIALSATLLPYLEAYVAMHSSATQNSFGRPQLLQVVGDTNFGLKLFSPAKPDRILAFGGSFDLYLLNGSGAIGLSNANFSMRGMASIDLTRRADPQKRVPLRFHSGLGYLFDGTESLISDIEAKSRGGYRISRVERFGLDINRVDSFLLGFGAEYVHKTVQPFLEWNFDIPANYRQGYKCSPVDQGRAPGDGCLQTASKFGATPSRLTIGTRITPAFIRGVQGLVAFDIGTGATSTFIEEVAPELPWRLFIGVGFAHDITSAGRTTEVPKVVEKVVQLPPPPEYRVVGLVLDEKTQQPIPNAIVKFQGQSLTGMVARQDGSFETTSLQPGTYTFAVTADGYREGVCTVTVAQGGTQPAPGNEGSAPNAAVADPLAMDASTQNPGGSTAAAAPSTTGGTSGPNVTNVACPLKALPAVGAVQGALSDAETNLPVTGAHVTIRDAKGRELSLEADGAGAFRFENVPVGAVKISVAADGYMPAAVDLEIRPKAEQRQPISLNKRPKKASVVVTAQEVKITKQINFANDSAVIMPESLGLVQEIALTLKEHPELARIEIQGHTDNTGAPAYNKRLSQERAEAVRNGLIALGVESARLTAVGYGPDKALVPNTIEANKAKNRRVQFIILDRK
ncbi:MAG TPA: carboxypeptidase regulatory-like domain-containing protein [Polyangiaceae bacterium]|nr:carboxypeptidase regulatory-like domain-containing protein [Polyangiaceae bacterium]